MVDVKKFSDINLYELVGVDINATEKEIRKAYRKKALECHPDKNPDNPKANELFNELSTALEILTNAIARGAYDKILNAKKAAELRNQQLDNKRRKIKADLEAREREANVIQDRKKSYNVSKTSSEILKEEIERLRKEGSKLLQEEQELMRQQIRQEILRNDKNFDSSKYRIKIKWKSIKDDPNNGGYTREILENFLKKYGDIEALVMSSSKNGSALVEFKTQEAAEMAMSYEKGILSNPLTLDWVEQQSSKKHHQNTTNQSNIINDKDYESLVLRQLRQAEERKRLIEQMMKEETEN